MYAYKCRPGAEAQEWHTDGAHFGKEASWGDEEVMFSNAPDKGQPGIESLMHAMQ